MIARKYGTTVNRLLQLNHRKSTMIHPGERLIVGQTKVYKPLPKPAVTPSDTLKQPAPADTLAPQPIPADSAKQEVMPLP